MLGCFFYLKISDLFHFKRILLRNKCICVNSLHSRNSHAIKRSYKLKKFSRLARSLIIFGLLALFFIKILYPLSFKQGKRQGGE